jgi:hypothetical protein
LSTPPCASDLPLSPVLAPTPEGITKHALQWVEGLQYVLRYYRTENCYLSVRQGVKVQGVRPTHTEELERGKQKKTKKGASRGPTPQTSAFPNPSNPIHEAIISAECARRVTDVMFAVCTMEGGSSVYLQ